VSYLALDGGGYDVIVRNQVGLAVWWGVLVCALCGLLPAQPLTRSAWGALALFGGFVAWTALAAGSSHSSERSLDELSRVICYLGVLALGVTIHRDRERAVRLTVGAVGSAIVAVAALALLSRLRPGLLATASQTASFLPGTRGRLAWPLNYWNALGAMTALGMPLLLAIASSARRLAFQAAAAAAVPVVALCGYLTFSRGGALAAAGGLLVFLALTGDRIPKLLTALVTGAGSAALIAGAVHRGAVENGLTGAVARRQGQELLIAVILVAAGTGLVQAGIGLAVRHGTRPRLLQVSRTRARNLLVVALLSCAVVALALNVPSRLSHAWREFKRPNAAALRVDSLARFGTTSGNQRYDYWKVAVQASSGHTLTGWGPGTFQLVWLPRAPYNSYVLNAHSLYFETLVEDGVVGLALLVGFFVLTIGAAGRLTVRSRHEPRTYASAVVAACVGFAISCAVDWVWQVPALVVAFLLLLAATLAPSPAGARRGDGVKPAPPWRRGATRAMLAGVAAVALIVIAVPLAAATALRQSRAAASVGNGSKALSKARAAARIEPGAASPQLQSALVLELQGNIDAALQAAQRATVHEPLNWSLWLVKSRLEAEAGHPAAAVDAFRRARALNPTSAVFATHRRPRRSQGA
jgi:O-antigen ligase